MTDAPSAATGTCTGTERGIYAAELRVVARQLMAHPSWGAVFKSGSLKAGSDGTPTMFHHPNFQALLQRVAADADRGSVFPPAQSVFRAFDLTPLESVKVVIIGQVSNDLINPTLHNCV